MNNLIWTLKARLYRYFRNGFPFNAILRGENRNLKLLLGRIDIAVTNVVDLGVGVGNVLQFFEKDNFVLGIDSNLVMLQQAKQKFENAQFALADALALPIKSEITDLVTAAGLIEYVEHIDLLFSEVFRILKSEGYFLFTFSPAGFWTGVRLLFGQRLFTRNFKQIEDLAQKYNWQCVDKMRSLMQCQVLVQKK